LQAAEAECIKGGLSHLGVVGIYLCYKSVGRVLIASQYGRHKEGNRIKMIVCSPPDSHKLTPEGASICIAWDKGSVVAKLVNGTIPLCDASGFPPSSPPTSTSTHY